MLALTGALSAACFVKLYGTVFLGKPRMRNIKKSREVSKGMLTAQGLLATLCILSGIFPTFVLEQLNKIPLQLFGEGLPRAVSHGWLWLTPISAKTAEYSAPLVAVGIVIALSVWWSVYLVMKPKRKLQNKGRVPPWDCGFGPLNSRMQYTGSNFSMPIRRIFSPVWQLSEEQKLQSRNGLKEHAHTLIYRENSEDVSWRLLYNPLVKIITFSTRKIGKIQTGHLRHYLAYSFFTLVVLLWLIS